MLDRTRSALLYNLNALKDTYSRAQYQNEMHNDLKHSLQVQQTYLNELETFKNLCALSIPQTDREMKAYTDDSLEKLTIVTDHALSKVRSLAEYRTHFEVRPVSDRYELHFHLYYANDPQKELMSPDLCPGKCVKQLLSMVLQLVSQKLQDTPYSMLDEPVSNANATSKENMKETFDLFLELGTGLYIVDQDPEIYYRLPRDEYYIEYNKEPGVKYGKSHIREVKRDVQSN